MFFLSFFENVGFALLGLSALIFLSYATWCATPLKYSKGLINLLSAFFIFYFSALFYDRYSFFLAHGVSYSILTFLRLFLMIGATIFLLMASSEILLSKSLPVHILFLFISLALAVGLYAVFVIDSVELEKNVRFVAPLIGLIYLFLSFISLPSIYKNRGSILAALSVFGLIEQMALNLFLKVEFSFIFTLVLILLLSCSYFMMLASHYNHEKFTTQDHLKRMSENMENIIKSSPFPILITKLKNDEIIFANQNAIKLFALDASEISRYHFKDFFVDDNNRKLLLEKLEHNKEIQDFEILVKTILGSSPFWLMVSANVIEYGNDIALYTAFQDITTRKAHEKILQNQADRDPLTSIFNRRYFEKIVPQKIKQAHQLKQNFAILMIDADHFKLVNDVYGHKIGDKVLIELAHVIERSIRPDDVVARYGGEEFVVFLNNADNKIAVLVAGRLREAIENAFVYTEKGQPVSWTVSIGVVGSGISDSVDTMIKMADDAMYLAKYKGRNRVEEYHIEEIENLKKKSMPRERAHPLLAGQEEEISLLDGVDVSHIVKD